MGMMLGDGGEERKFKTTVEKGREERNFMKSKLNSWGGNPVVPEKPIQITIEDNLTEAKAVIKQLTSALLDATMIRGIYAGLNDPLALQGEKQELRERFLQIEAKINAAIETSRRFLK